MSQDRNEELTALDQELAKMAQDVPEMPDDFHARWTEQIREQAAQEKNASRHENRRQWRYVLSAAAVFVFLIGGTLLTRRSGNSNLLDSSALSNSAHPQESVTLHMNVSGTANGTANESPVYEAAEEAVDGAVYESAVYEAAEEAEEPAYAAAGAAEEPAKAAEAAGTFLFAAKTASSARTEETAAGAAYEAEEADMAVYADAAADMGACEEEAAESMMGEAAEEAPEPEPAPESEPEAAITEGKSAGDETGAAAEEKTESEFLSFLKDLGIFTLKTLVVVLCGGALACLAAVIHRALKNRKK